MTDFNWRSALESILGANGVPTTITETSLAMEDLAVRLRTAGLEIDANGTIRVLTLSANSVTIDSLTANNSLLLNDKAESELSVASAVEADSAATLGGVAEANLNVNSALFANTSESTNTALTANNSTNLNGQAASYYTNASNLATGTVPTARLTEANTTANGIVTTAAQSLAGDKTFANTVNASSALVIPVGIDKYAV